MLAKEFYDKHGNYDEAMSRFSNEMIIKLFLGKFLKDRSYENFCKALETQEIDEAFQAAHAFKGVVGNMAFEHLYGDVSEAVEILRKGQKMPNPELIGKIMDTYESIVYDISRVIECE